MGDKHTPWFEHGWSPTDDGVPIFSGRGIKVAVALYSGGTEQPKTTAALIVRAVNCHEELVEALEDIAVYWNGCENRTATSDACHHNVEIARAALAKVEASDG